MRMSTCRLFLAVILIVSVAAVPAAASAGWQSFAFSPGYMLEYALNWSQDDVEIQGTLGILAQEAPDDELYLILTGDFGEEEFAVSVAMDPNDPEEVFMMVFFAMMMDMPEDVMAMIGSTLWFPWFDSPMHGEVFDSEWAFYDEEEPDEAMLYVTGRESFGGFEGWVMEFDAADWMGANMTMCMDEGVPLPLMVSLHDVQEWHEMGEALAGAILSVELLDFQTDAEPLDEVPNLFAW